MTETPIATFAPVDASPQPPAEGVAIAARWDSSHGTLRRLTLHGAFQVSNTTASELAAQPLQRALVVTLTAGVRFASFNLVGQQLTFPDDDQRDGGSVRGYFNTDLVSRFGLEPHEGCFVLVSLGPHLSNVIEVQPGDGEGLAE